MWFCHSAFLSQFGTKTAAVEDSWIPPRPSRDDVSAFSENSARGSAATVQRESYRTNTTEPKERVQPMVPCDDADDDSPTSPLCAAPPPLPNAGAPMSWATTSLSCPQGDDDGAESVEEEGQQRLRRALERYGEYPLREPLLRSALSKLACPEALRNDEVFELLFAFAKNDPRLAQNGLQCRATASPLFFASARSTDSTVYVACRRPEASSTTTTTTCPKDSVARISVSFQSVVNSQVWWSPFTFRDGESLGLATRLMSRCDVRQVKERHPQSHGYRGRMYSLVAVRDASERRQKIARTSVVLFGDIHVVAAWRDDTCNNSESHHRHRRRGGGGGGGALHCVQEEENCIDDDAQRLSWSPLLSTYIVAPQPAASRQIITGRTSSDAKTLLKRPRADEAATVFSAPSEEEEEEEVPSSLHVRGDFIVDGAIYGRLATPGADYAEYFAMQPGLAAPVAGSVVQLRIPELVLALDTSGAGPCLVVSGAPAVAARYPAAPPGTPGAFVAILGQVPVRCRGRVLCGDLLVPSGRHDGTAVAAETHRTSVLGFVIQPPPEDGVTVSLALCFVRWHDDLHGSQRRSSSSAHTSSASSSSEGRTSDDGTPSGRQSGALTTRRSEQASIDPALRSQRAMILVLYLVVALLVLDRLRLPLGQGGEL